VDLSVEVGPLRLRSPLVAASGTVGSVIEFSRTVDLTVYGAAVAKSISRDPWPGRSPPRLAPAGLGMLNGIGIQNPGVAAWVAEIGPRLAALSVPVWGSAVGTTASEYAEVSRSLARSGVAAIEVNLSCPNLEGGRMFALDPDASAEVVRAAKASSPVPVGAKLSPNSERIGEVAAAVAGGGADFVTVANTVLGAGIDRITRRPVLSGVIGGYSGPPIKPIALRCVIEVRRAVPSLPIVGCGGVSSGRDVIEFMLAGAAAVGIGTAHFAEPRAGKRILGELIEECRRLGVQSVAELTGGAEIG